MFPKLISSFFKKQQSRNSLNKDIFHKLELLKLEQRITPAVNLSPFLQLPEHNLVIITQDLLSKVPQQELVNATVVTLDPAQDVISQISNQLANRNGLDTIRIISHGKDGELLFGNQVVDQSVLVTRGSEIASWGKSLAPDADILLYGCSVATSEAGKNFVTTLAGLTGADIAASINPTGAGADTNLEYNAGLVTAGLQASKEAWNKNDLLLNPNQFFDFLQVKEGLEKNNSLLLQNQFGDFVYTNDGTSISITGYTGNGGIIIIPDFIDNLPVTEIGLGAFYLCNGLTGVTIPNSVVNIEVAAFAGCSGLTGITIPSSVITIGAGAFSVCTGLTNIIIPDSVTSIGGTSFYKCTGLTSVTLSGNITTIDGLFFGCTGLTSITIPNGVISIGNSAFNECSALVNLTLGSNITSIGPSAFYKCSGLTSVTIPNSVTSIGDSAFGSCSALTSITIPDSVTSIGDGAFDRCTGLTNVTLPNGIDKISNGLFYLCTGLTSFIVPNSVATISNGAFLGCTNLASVTIPTGVTTISNLAFYLCSGLTNITFPSSVISIGDYAFYGCENLIDITIPNNVTSIGESGFMGCSGLSSFTFSNRPTNISDNLFWGCTSLINITIPDSVTSIGRYSFYSCISLTSVIIPYAVTRIGDYSFNSCSALTSVTISGSVTRIGDGAFIFCTGLNAITIPNSVTTFGNRVFEGCSGLASVIIPENLTSISSSSFYGCANLTNITIPDSVIVIDLQAFEDCTSLANITIPNSVVTIGDKAFKNCTGLISVDFEENVSTLDYFDTTSLININSVGSSIGDSAFSGCTGLTTITIPGNITNVIDSAFSGCTGLTTITIPSSVTNIGDFAFENCSAVINLYFLGNAPTLGGPNVFTNVSGTIYYPSGATGWGTTFGGLTAVAVFPPSITPNNSNLSRNTNTLTIIGSGFDSTAANNTVNFSSGTGHVTSATSNQLIVTFDTAPTALGSLTVVVTSNGFSSVNAVQVANVVNPANTPTFGTPTSNANGFTVQISNYDFNFTYVGTATAGSVFISGTGLITVAGLSPNTSSTATITTTRTNYASGSAQVTATAQVPAVAAPLVTGTPASSSGGSSTVTLHDPVTGEETGTAVPFPGFSGPIKVVSGDFNNDGVADLIAGAGFGGGPAIAILNSQTGEVMESFFAFDPSFTGGVFVAVEDVNGDGILDIIAGAGPGGGPEVRIFDGGSLNVLRSFYAYDQSFTGGVSIATIDFNHDGILDLVTGAGPGAAPHVKVFDGATNAIISQWYAFPVTFTGGVFVAAGDIGNDGNIEVVTGAGQGGAPVVAVWNPYTGALLAQFMAYAEDFTGGVRVGINDGNSDGIADIISGAGPGGGPQVNVFSFPALDLLFSFYSGDPANTGGVFVS